MITTDASEIGIGAVLVQYDKDVGADRPVYFLSKKMSTTEVNYPTVEKELYAVIYALGKLRRYLLDKEFDLYTDSSAVRYLLTRSSPGSCLQRWVIATQEFQFMVHHLPGKRNVVADILSRYPPLEEPLDDPRSPDEILRDYWFVDQMIDPQTFEYEEYLMKIRDQLTKPMSEGNSNALLLGPQSLYKVDSNMELFRRSGET